MTFRYVGPHDPRKHPTIVALFDKLYSASIPTMQMQSIEEQKAIGVRVTGDPEIDRALRSERTQTYMSIAKMASYFNEGVNVGVTNPDDCKEIYDTVVDHLSQWESYVKSAIHISRAPLEDLIALDRFAAAVYKHARHQYSSEWLHNPLATLSGNATISALMNSIHAAGDSVTNHRTEFERTAHEHVFVAKQAEHETLADMFKRVIVRPRR